MRRPHPPEGLEALIRKGALRRKGGNFDSFVVVPSTIAAIASAASIYVAVMLLASRTDWTNILMVAAVTGAIPLVAIGLLFVGARRTHPFSMSLAVVAFAASFAIAFISALRVPTSYTGILMTLPTSLFFVTLANLAMMRAMQQNVALLAFPNVQDVARSLGWSIPIVGAGDNEMRFRRVLIDPVTHHTPEWSARLAHLYFRGIEIETWPSYLEVSLGRVDLESFDLSHVSYSPSQIFYYRFKRVCDLVGVLLLAVPASILCAIIWVYIRILDGAPAVFVQERRGYAGRTFRLYKFRTMYNGDNVGSTSEWDSRIMPGCRLLRQTRLDELPQLINILKGDMSFVGPRPVALSVAEAIEAKMPLYVNRHSLLPGLTGWAQVQQGYAQTDDEEILKLSYDLYYLKYVSIDLDIQILFRTVKTILFRIGGR